MIDRLLHVLVCGIAEGFFLLVCALTHPAGSSKCGTSRKKYATILQIKTSNEMCALLDTMESYVFCLFIIDTCTF